MRISDWSSDVCSSDLAARDPVLQRWLAAYMGEVARTLAAPPGVSLPDYQRSLIQRFRNPAIDDRLLRLAQDTCEKFRQALLPPLQQRQTGRASSRERVCQYV